MEKNKKINLILLIAILILSVLYFLSLLNIKNSGNKKKIVKTALINSKYESTINNFVLQKGEQRIYLTKQNDVWFTSTVNSNENLIPADNEKIKLFIKDLIKVVNLYKISDNIPAKNEFGLFDEDTFVISYDNNQIFFGNYDFSKTSRYLMTGKNTKVYEINTNLDKYLSTSIQAWSDPYIISRVLFPVEVKDIQTILGQVRKDCDLQKLLELRHGGAAITPNAGEPELSFILITGDTSEIEIKIFPTASESEYNVELKYKTGQNSKTFECALKISLWTYNKIKNIML